MGFIDVDGRQVEVDEKGFLTDFGDWSEKVAETLAKDDGLELGRLQWEAIHFMRAFYSEYEVIPSRRHIVKAIESKLHRRASIRKTIDELFPGEGCKQACRLAGLPEYYCHSC